MLNVQLAVLTAAFDDEPETEEERAAVEAALADPSPDVPFEQIRRVPAWRGACSARRREAYR